jgi:hypothetical protein
MTLEEKEAGRARFLSRLALLLVALILLVLTLAGVLTARILTGVSRLVGLTLALLLLVLALTRSLALTLTLLVGALVRVLLAALFVRHIKISSWGSHHAIHRVGTTGSARRCSGCIVAKCTVRIREEQFDAECGCARSSARTPASTGGNSRVAAALSSRHSYMRERTGP